MLIIGLTGSIGMGKTTAAEGFRALGIQVFDADAEVHRLYEGALVGPIGAAFPGVVAGGRIDRAALSAQLIAAPQRFAELEAIVHPRVRESERAFLHAEHARGVAMSVLEIPLLFETGGERLVDVVVVVSADAKTQSERVLARPGMTPAKLKSVLARQMADGEKRRRADFVVDTNGSAAHCHRQIGEIVARLETQRRTAFKRHWIT